MSTHLHSHDEDLPRFEPWLGVMVSAFLPAVVGLYVHARFLPALIAATVALFVASLVMLRRQSVRRAIEQQSVPQSALRSASRARDQVSPSAAAAGGES